MRIDQECLAHMAKLTAGEIETTPTFYTNRFISLERAITCLTAAGYVKAETIAGGVSHDWDLYKRVGGLRALVPIIPDGSICVDIYNEEVLQ